MANFIEYSEEQKEQFAKWVAARPPAIQEMIRKFPPYKLYMLKTTKNRVTINSYCEDGSMTVDVTAEFNLLVFERRVFGILPEDLEECNLPDPHEPIGVLLTESKHIDAFVRGLNYEQN